MLDIGHWIAGPFGPTLLGDFGADVIRIDRPGGQGTPLSNPVSWALDSRNKKSITLALDGTLRRSPRRSSRLHTL